MSDDYKHFLAGGHGATEAEAALDFFKDLRRQLPQESGRYDFYIRRGLEEMITQENFDGSKEHHCYMRGSYRLVAAQDREFENETVFNGFGGAK